METNTQSTQVNNTCSHESCKCTTQRSIGKLLSTGGVIFMLAGIMFFISLLCAIYLKLDIVTAFIIASLIVGIASFGTGSYLIKK